MKTLLVIFFFLQNTILSPTPSPTATPSPTPDAGVHIVGLTWERAGAWIIGLAALLTAGAVIYKYVWLPLKGVWKTIKNLDELFGVLKEIAVAFGKDGENLPAKINSIDTNLAELTAMTELLLANSPTATYLMDDKGQCTYVNEAWIAITGMSREKAAGNGWTKAIHDEDRARVFDEWQDARKDDRPFACDFRFVHQHTGNISFVRASSVAVKNKRLIIVAYIGELKVLSQTPAAIELSAAPDKTE